MINNLLVEHVYFITPDSVQYPIFGGARAIMSWRNFGMPDINYLSDKGPNQHGITVRDYRARERTITIRQFERGCRRIDWWYHEAELIDHLRPNRSSTAAAGKLLVIMPDNTEREIPARILRGPGGEWDGSSSLRAQDMDESYQFLCEDPFWRNPTQQSITFTIALINSCLDTCLPICLGENIINQTTDITYTGTWDGDQIDIVYTGPMNNPILTNETTGKEIKLNYNISSGEQVTISISPLSTKITNNSGTDLIGVVDSVSDLVTFFLATESDLTSDGTNTIRVFASNGESGVSGIVLRYYIRDISVFTPTVTR